MKLYSIRKLKWEALENADGSFVYRTRCGSLIVWELHGDGWLIRDDQSCQAWDCASKAMIVASRRHYNQLRESLVVHQRQEG